jgi:hypothetical protein
MPRRAQRKQPRREPDDDLVGDPVLLASTQPMVVVRPILVDVKTAAHMVSLSPATLWAQIYEGNLPTIRYRKRRLVRLTDLEAWVDQLEVNQVREMEEAGYHDEGASA